jgi:NADH-quinone oxidoreductase subunit C
MKDKFAAWQSKFNLTDLKIQRSDQCYISVTPEHTVPFITFLKDFEGYTHLVFFTAVDHIEEGVFKLLYMLHNYETHHDLAVQCLISRENSTMETIHHLWPHGATYQRELKEMFGIDFPDSPGVNDNFVLEGWHDIPPMRREFNTTEYSVKTFFPRPGRIKHDTTEHMKKALYPSEAETW